MATEAKRGCGFRKVGGLYLVAKGIGVPCMRLPVPLDVCPTCSHGIKQSRGWTWINAKELFAAGDLWDCPSPACPVCPVSHPPEKAGLTWVGGKFYPKPSDWMLEADRLGVSRRISMIPKDLKLGETWVFVAHPVAVTRIIAPINGGEETVTKVPGIFHAFKPTAIEQIVTRSQSEDEEFMARLDKRGITPVIVPDDDKDHQGTVYRKQQEEIRI